MRRWLPACLAGLLLAGCASDANRRDTAELAEAHYEGELRVDPDPIRIDDTRVGCLRSVSVELENADPDSDVTIRSVAASSAALRIGSASPITLQPGARRSLDLVFAPSAAGAWSATLEITTDEGTQAPLRVAATATALERSAEPPDLASLAPLDLVLVLDVSTTMDEIGRLREALHELFDFVEANGLDVRFGLTTFENDVIVHQSGAFLDRTAFFAELDSQLVSGSWVPNPELPRQLVNFDFAENSLDALYRSATAFALRPGARHAFLLMTDDTFLEPPSVFSDGTPVLHSYADVSTTLDERGVRLYSLHSSAKGRGLSSGYGSQPALVASTGGAWFELEDVQRGSLRLGDVLTDLVTGRECP